MNAWKTISYYCFTMIFNTLKYICDTSARYLNMSPHFLTRRCSTKQSHRSRLVERYMFVICVILIALTQQTSPTLNITYQTLQILPSCQPKLIKFSGDGELQLRVFYKSSSHARNYRIRCVVSLMVPLGKYLSVKISPFKMSASCNDETAARSEIFRYGTSIARPCVNDNYYAHRAIPLAQRLRTTVVKYHSNKNSEMFRFFFVCHISVAVNFTIDALDANFRHNLVVSHQTSTSGTLTQYSFDGSTNYALNMRASATLNPPPGHSVMVSFPHVDIMTSDFCFLDLLGFHVGGVCIFDRCGRYRVPIQVHRAKVWIVLETSNRSKNCSGFKLKFSFHGVSETPNLLLTTSLNTAVFNCSVPFYTKFKQHLKCNLEKECSNAEDEARCLYSGGACEPDFISASNKCYKYIKLGMKPMTWYDAFAMCLHQGLRLVSFSSLKEEVAFRDTILQFTFTTNHFFFGLRTSDSVLPAMYREVWQWSSGIMAYHVNIEEKFLFKPTCAALNRLSKDKMSVKICGAYLSMHFIFCEPSVVFNSSQTTELVLTKSGSTFGVKRSIRFVSCSGHEMHDFLSCDHLSICGAELGVTSCETYSEVQSETTARRVKVVMFICDSQTQTIHYTQVCDHHAQCFDSSDETFCIHKTCSERQCLNLQCVTDAQWCDGMAHCTDASDESCPQFVIPSDRPPSALTSGFHVVLFDGYGRFRYVPQGDEFPGCPPTHFLCSNHQLCLPAYLRCNAINDCFDREDESNCEDVTCPGYYRCLRSAICVHSDHVCDGVFQCPQQDDELLCELICPDYCLCQGLAFVCSRPFPAQNHTNLRYLDASDSGLTPDRLLYNHYLIRLVLSRCSLQILPMLNFPNMKFLDLSDNQLTDLDMHVFLNLLNLNFLNLGRNPIVALIPVKTNVLLEKVHSLDLSHTSLKCFVSNCLWNIRNLKTLNLSHSMLNVIDTDGLGSLTQIESLDLRGTDLKEYPVKMLQSLSSLQVLYSDTYKLCCHEVLPDQFNIQNCHTSPDEIASCKDLLRSDNYRMFLWIICCFALIGNAVSFAAKIYLQRGKRLNSFNIFITNLNVSDFLMGLYLAVVGSADQVYRGTYLWHDEVWKTSAGCQVAGFFSLLSCEMSAFMICFITLDRFLVMRFPFSQLHFRNKSAGVVCVLSWFVGVVLAAVPLLPMTSNWNFYGQTGICIPLPVTRKKFEGHYYSFGILIVFNFLLFVFIVVGQLFIYLSIRDNSLATAKNSEREATVARRLLTVVMSDFLCWFPIGLLGLLASNGIPIPGEVNVALAILALPLNSALNPFLYTFNLLMEKRGKASEQRLLKVLQSRISG